MTTTTTPATTTHLAQLHLDLTNRNVLSDLRDHTNLHRRICGLFPDNTGTAPRTAYNVLYRLERTENTATLLVQSTGITINRTALPAGYTTNPVEYRDLTPLLDWLTPGTAVRYRIDANPIKAVSIPGRRGRRTALRGDDAVTWWQQRAHRNGIEPTLILDSPNPPVLASRNGAQRAKIASVRFEGIATITEPTALRHAITTGIGQGRAYGLGLLSIAPHQQ
ncbi:type I-E CRISPR-associated protein Cas6/Cse3/CasE [Streptomyces sp. RPA4-5]|uniref:type I-E CRISPR-associated protein Cas6/Cse3/CasE n=1 Tax=Streptomyces sp. RPA4-5 TaxID=2721245 RepID=UPI00143E6171|nr:type I-E CRISPR-associated protein Cas6/Cse3/CasE [Streptomyces sp. RPA4-5]QIY53485.1 type I-E CRISPR-associated protein Cas6/Cse3/CasE [Streptomyces sp. RPA4-5]